MELHQVFSGWRGKVIKRYSPRVKPHKIAQDIEKLLQKYNRKGEIKCFLAFKELKFSKAKFALIITVVILISYLVYFLTSLANGLASSYTNAIEQWNSNQIVLTVDANDNMMMSYMNQDDFDAIEVKGDKTKLGLFPAVINNPLAENVLDSRVDVYFFGIDDDSFIKPSNLKDISLKDNQVIVDDELKKEGYEVGDQFGVTGSEQLYEIVGFSSKTTYQTAPVVFMSLDTWQAYRYGTSNTPDLFSGTVVKGETNNLPNNLLSYDTADYISTLPGYTAQVLTFSVMIVFLIIITAFVLGIFIYVLTIQKNFDVWSNESARHIQWLYWSLCNHSNFLTSCHWNLLWLSINCTNRYILRRCDSICG